jgi:mono/diheme cytochrome c family protein
MIQTRLAAMLLMGLCVTGAHTARPRPTSGLTLHRVRMSPSDLEIAGFLNGVASGEPRYVRYSELLTLPQETYTVSDDSNFKGTVTVTGIPMEQLPKLLGAQPGATMMTAVCDDAYAAHYPPEYLAKHHAVLVLKVNGKPPDQWPVGADGAPMGPYMISHPNFTPAFEVLAHKDEPQMPWGVMRIEFLNAEAVYAPIDPAKLRVAHDKDPEVLQGYAIARQNCFRCHGRSDEGGTKSSKSWDAIGRFAAGKPKVFEEYVRAPKLVNPQSEMPDNPQYDEATLKALRTYFSLFAKETTP